MGVNTSIYSVAIVCFAALCVVRCSTSSSTTPSSSAEDETSAAAPESYELMKTLPYDNDNDNDSGSEDEADSAADNRHMKRFIVPVSTSDLGLDIGPGPYYGNYQHRQNPQKPQPSKYRHHQQQQQQQQPQPQYHQQGQGQALDGFGFEHTAPGAGHYTEQTDGGDGGAEHVTFDNTGFTDFVPSSGYRSPTSPAAGGAPQYPSAQHPTPTPPAAYSSLFDGDGGAGGQLSFDNNDFGHELPSAGYGGTADGGVFGGGFGGSGRGGGVPAGYEYNPPAAHQTPIVHKSIYVHVAPPDDEPPRKQRVIMPNTPPKKNYQIVFIKAPTSPPPAAPIIPPPPQHSDKTLIYVLHPKQEEAPPIHIPAPPITQPLKPEVYFIKYKTRDEPTSHGTAGGGDLHSPGEEFGGGSASGGEVGSDGYLHRRYGRGDRTPAPQPLTSMMSPTADSAQDSAQDSARDPVRGDPSRGDSAADDADDAAGGGPGNGMAPAQLELADPEATIEATSEAYVDRTAVDRTVSDETGRPTDEPMSRGGYSAEYADASVESSNLSETLVMSVGVPKGKNGH